MKAIVQRRYGVPHKVLSLENIAVPGVSADEVLVRVRAASVNPDVWHAVAGRPYLLRLMGSGVLRPKNGVPGTDVAGIVEAVGTEVTKFQPGDEVFGETVLGFQWKNGGSYAEFVRASEEALVSKPTGVTFEQAAAAGTSALIALDNLGDLVEPGQSVLVNGAGGGVGTFAVQIAKARGGIVTAVDRGDKLGMLRSIGADTAIDYEVDDFTLGDPFDVIFDIPGNRSFSDLKRALADGGQYVLIGHDRFGHSGGRWLGKALLRFARLALFGPLGRMQKGSKLDTQGRLRVMRELLDSGQVVPHVDRTFPLSEAVEAMKYLESGTAAGKVVLTV